MEAMLQISIGMALHAATCAAGNIGSPGPMEYAVVGDLVNVISGAERPMKLCRILRDGEAS